MNEGIEKLEQNIIKEEILTELKRFLQDELKKIGVAIKEVLNFAEAAIFLEMSESYLYKLTSAQKIPHYKPLGKLCYFNRFELQEWLMRNRINTVEDIEAEAISRCLALEHKKCH